MGELISSAYHMKDLIESVAWKDMKKELEDVLDQIHINMETVDEEREFRRFQGRAEGIRLALTMPSVMLEILEEKSERKLEEEDLDDE